MGIGFRASTLVFDNLHVHACRAASWLYWFGRLFLNIFSSKHLRGLYVLGGICGGLLYMIAYNVFPYFEDAVFGSYLLGASASVLAIVIATAVREPDYQVQLLFIGGVRLKYMALFMIVLDLMFLTAENAGGHIAHLGGALAGWWFASGSCSMPVKNKLS